VLTSEKEKEKRESVEIKFQAYLSE